MYERQLNNQIEQHQRRNRSIHYNRFYIFIAAMILFAVILVFSVDRAVLAPYTGVKTQNKQSIGQTTLNDQIDLVHINSKYAVLLDLKSGETLAEHNSQKKIYPASLTKIITAILAIEHTHDLNKTITMPSDFYQNLYAENASMAGFQPGENVSIKDLLYGVLLPSGADGSHETEQFHITDALNIYNQMGNYLNNQL